MSKVKNDENEQERDEKTLGDEIVEENEENLALNNEDEDEEEEENDDKAGDKDENESEENDEELGDAGKRALERERKERKRLEKENKDLLRKMESEDERKLREAREEAAKEAAGTWKARFVKAEARSALTQAGATSKSEKLLNLIDLDKVEIDEDGDIDGLEDQIDDLKDEFPELFGTKQKKYGKGDVGNKDEAKAPKSIGERLAANLQ